MSRRIAYSPWFDADLHLRIAWYAEQGGVKVAERFVSAVESTVRRVTDNPGRGRRPYPADPDLAELHCVLIERPFDKHLLYFRFNDDTLTLERLLHGAQDRPRALREPPN